MLPLNGESGDNIAHQDERGQRQVSSNNKTPTNVLGKLHVAMYPSGPSLGSSYNPRNSSFVKLEILQISTLKIIL